MDRQTEVRRAINKHFLARGLSLNKDALNYLTDQLKDMDQPRYQKTMARVMELVERENVPNGLLTLDILKGLLKILLRQRKHESEIDFKLENAFEWRRQLKLDKRRAPAVEVGPLGWERLSLHSYWQRFELVKQLLEESLDTFASVDSLLTHRGTNVRILAQLCRGDGTGFIAEDHTGKVRLGLAGAQYQPGLYFEGGIFVFEGIQSPVEELLQVERVSLPRLRPLAITEGRDEQKQQQELQRSDPNDRIAFFSDLLLDNDKVMRALYHILEGFAASPPNVFVLCGRFLSVQLAHGYTEQSSTAFRHLANMITQFGPNYSKTHFVLVPSQEDPPPLFSLPCPPLPLNVQKCFKDMPNVHFATNPCRLIFKDQHIVVCRDDAVEKLCRSAIHMPMGVRAETIPELFCHTIWSQRHLSPLPLYYSPVHPNLDALFQLWPAPDVLLLADKFKAFVQAEDDQKRLTINPGPFSGGHFEFQLFFPTLKRVETSVYTSE